MSDHAAMMASMGHGTSAGGAPWPSAAAAFVAMWTMMMVAMMLPSLWPTLRRYRRGLEAMAVSRPAFWTAVVGAGYTGVWAAIGLMVFVLHGIVGALAGWTSHFAHIAPLITSGVIVASAGLQFTSWKAHQLAHCRGALPTHDPRSVNGHSAWSDGVRLGMHCTMSCLGPMATLLAVGMMDIRAMVVVSAAVTAERIVPNGARAARATGAIALAAGVLVLARAIGVAGLR
jgi:predicted metal-binding membrane protein